MTTMTIWFVQKQTQHNRKHAEQDVTNIYLELIFLGDAEHRWAGGRGNIRALQDASQTQAPQEAVQSEHVWEPQNWRNWHTGRHLLLLHGPCVRLYHEHSELTVLYITSTVRLI